jgi:hypothetical protein
MYKTKDKRQRVINKRQRIMDNRQKASSGLWPSDETTPCRPSREGPRARASEATTRDVSRILGRVRWGVLWLVYKIVMYSETGLFDLVYKRPAYLTEGNRLPLSSLFLIRINGAAQRPLSTTKRRALGEGGRALEVNASHAGKSVTRHVPHLRPHEVHRVHLIYP